jgi:hypothetical protein
LNFSATSSYDEDGSIVDQPRNLAKSVTVEWFCAKVVESVSAIRHQLNCLEVGTIAVFCAL